MNPAGKAFSLFYALLLFVCALFAGYETLGFAFGIGEAGGHPGVSANVFLIVTLVGGAGLAFAALGSWTRSPAFSLIALVSALLVLPAFFLFSWTNGRAQWFNTQWLNTHSGEWHYHYGLWDWASVVLPPFLGLLAMVVSWFRYRQFAKPAQSTVGRRV